MKILSSGWKSGVEAIDPPHGGADITALGQVLSAAYLCALNMDAPGLLEVVARIRVPA
jgi:hypothetical protein